MYMALNVLPQAPTVTGVYQVRDFVPQLNDASKSAASALQNAFKFGTQVHDYKIQRDQEKLLSKENDRQTLIKENIQNDEILLAKLEKELAELKAGKDVEIRSGEQMMPQNLTPTMQSYMDNLKKTDANNSFWNFKPAEVSNG